MDAVDTLQTLLRQLFRLNEPPDLDFGIHRVINLKRKKISDYVDKELPKKIADILNEQNEEIGKTKHDALKRAREEVGGAANLDKDGNFTVPGLAYTPAGKEYLRIREQVEYLVPPKKAEEAIYGHLAAFFGRYECGGDFVPRRRHSIRNRYAAPHNGEEVLLHWANRDQYYIKSTAYHPAIAFKVNDKRFQFQITEACDIPRDNNKDTGRFLFPEIDKVVQDKGGDIVVPFTFRSVDKQEQKRLREISNNEKSNGNENKIQRGILIEALNELKKTAKNNPDLRQLLTVHAGGEDSAFMSHARRFVRRNTADFFIHRNLRKFLTEELDLYLKSEVLSAEELAGLNGFAIASRMVVFRVIRELGGDIIDALAEWEDLQKILWEKKKFVLQTEYCVAIGHIPDVENSSILNDIAKCKKQWVEWEKLGIDCEKKNADFLRKNLSLPIDTANFLSEFKDRLLAQFSDIDNVTDGVLIHGENWQMLNLIQEMYRGRVKCIYIDPPYNTGPSEILYKNEYKHSSWLSMMENRISLSSKFMTQAGTVVCAIDENEVLRLGMMLECVFPPPEYEKNCLTVVHNPKGIQGGFVSVNNEYAFVVSRAGQVANTMPIPEEEWEWEKFRNWGGESERHTAKNCFYPIVVRDEKIVAFGDVCPDDYHPKKNEIDKDGNTLVYPIDKNGIERKWTYARQSTHEIAHLLRTTKNKDGIDIERSHDWKRFKTVWSENRYIAGDYGSKPLKQILGEKRFDFPKAIPLVMDCIRMTADSDSFVLDYFAGSGTTAHAVVNLNREYGGRRKFILAEAGDYVNTVVLPRIRKIIYSPAWKDGKPSRKATTEEIERGPRLVKYQRIESYEDTLANIRFRSDELDLKKITPRYELEWESRKSPVRILESGLENPFSYTLELVAGDETNRQSTLAKTVDLPETFAYLIGLRVRTQLVEIDKQGRRYLIQRGKCEGQEIAVIWRDTKGWNDKDFENDRKFIKEKLAPEAQRVLVNGSACGKELESLNPIFAKKMFSEYEKA